MRIAYCIGGAALAGVAVMVAILAFATTSGNEPDGIDALTAQMIRRDARHASDLPPLVLEIEEAQIDPGAADPVRSATVRWRTIFDVPFGVTRMDGPAQSNTFSFGRLFGVWTAFVAGELLLLVGAGWMWLRAADER